MRLARATIRMGRSIRRRRMTTYDYNRDKLVNATDQIIADNRTSPFTALKLITPPLEPAGGAGRRRGRMREETGVRREET